MMDLGSNNYEETAIKTSSPLLIKRALCTEGLLQRPARGDYRLHRRRGRRRHRSGADVIKWSGPGPDLYKCGPGQDLYTQVPPLPSSGRSVLVTKKHVIPKLCDILMLTNTKNREKAVPLPFDRRTCVSPYLEGLYVILSLRTVERRRCYWQVISINVFHPRHQLKDATTKLLKIQI